MVTTLTGFRPPGAENVGIEVEGCAVDDDLSQALGNPDEARLATALEYLTSGSCEASSAAVNAKRRHPLSSVRGQVVKAEPLTGSILRALK